MKPLVAVFANRLRTLRKAAGLTQEELGRDAALDYKHIGSIERGEKMPSFEAVERLAKALKVDYYELFLPDDLSLGRTDQDLKVAVREIDSHGSKALKMFLRQVLSAARSLARDGGSERT
jgi:transcriptional regulator with XRE-family HTH domain